MPRDPNALHVSISPEIDHVPFGDYEGLLWTLEIQCWSCKRETVYGPAEVAAIFGAHRTTGDLSRLGRCQTPACGHSAPHMKTVVIDPPADYVGGYRSLPPRRA